MTIRIRQRILSTPFVALVFGIAFAPASNVLAQDAAPAASVAPTQAVADALTPAEPTTPAVRMAVTGSNIRRVQPPASLPLLDIDRAYIERSGTTTAPELLQTIPQLQNFGGALPSGTRR
jgi:hypothetical protein